MIPRSVILIRQLEHNNLELATLLLESTGKLLNHKFTTTHGEGRDGLETRFFSLNKNLCVP